MEVQKIKVEKREPGLKRDLKLMRKSGRIPCELYGDKKNLHFSVDKADIRSLIYTPDFKLADLQFNGEVFRCIVKEIQFHPVTDEIIHMDFLKLVDGRPIKVDLPVRFEGISPGVGEGGRLIRQLRHVAIKTTPEHLVDELILDISELELGHSVRVRDIELGNEIEVLTNPGIPVASVKVPRILLTEEEEAAEAAEAAAALEGEGEGEEGEGEGGEKKEDSAGGE
ncbi:MAG: 50S ribosomal protein L25 [Saprospiraceae bacterium]|nr:50S ribosomal protein L25 [Saprospiraceae bacterium]